MAKAPRDGEEIELIINVEAQNKYNPGYPLEMRAFYYGCRMISGQYGTVFTKSHYEKIKKVYSIWICTDVPEDKADSINLYRMDRFNIFGATGAERPSYDLLTIVMVCLKRGESIESAKPKILEVLDYVMMNENDSYEQKRRVLEQEFAIKMTPKLEKGMSEMCNLSEGLYDRTLARVKRDVTEQVELQKAIKVALNMLKKKMRLDDIVDIVELPADEIRKIAKDNGLAVS